MAPTKLCFAGSQNPRSEFKSRPREFAAYAFLINNLRKATGKTLGHYCFRVRNHKRAGLKTRGPSRTDRPSQAARCVAQCTEGEVDGGRSTNWFRLEFPGPVRNCVRQKTSVCRREIPIQVRCALRRRLDSRHGERQREVDCKLSRPMCDAHRILVRPRHMPETTAVTGEVL